MATFEDHFQMGLLALEKLKPGFREKMARLGYNHPSLSDVETGFPGKTLSITDATILPAEITPTEEGFDEGLPSLEGLIKRTGDFSPGSVVLGVCEDSLPFVLDLANPAPGAMLLAGDSSSGKTRFLRSLLKSAVILNQPDEVCFSLILNDPQEYLILSQQDHCQHCLASDDEASGEIIQELANIAEQRRHGLSGGPAYLLVIDDLEACLHHLAEQDYSRLFWLARHGARSRIWTIATIRPGNADLIDPRLMASFRTRIIGNMKDHNMAGYLSGDEEMDSHELEAGIQFLLPFGGAWLPIWICDPIQE